MSIWKDVGWGIGGGLFFACFYSLFVLVLFAVQGGEPFEANGISLGATIVVYFFGGITAGILVGLLRPFTKRKLGAVLVGIVAAVPVFTGIGFALEGPVSQWDEASVFATITCSVLLGGYGGYALWRMR